MFTKIVTIEEAKSMLGTEFIYNYSDGDCVRAYIKAFDPKIGLTCITLDTKTARGEDPINSNWSATMEEDGTWCVMAYNFKDDSSAKTRALKALTLIRDTGNYTVNSTGGFPACAF